MSALNVLTEDLSVWERALPWGRATAFEHDAIDAECSRVLPTDSHPTKTKYLEKL